jgi:hypothetical protein
MLTRRLESLLVMVVLGASFGTARPHGGAQTHAIPEVAPAAGCFEAPAPPPRPRPWEEGCSVSAADR